MCHHWIRRTALAAGIIFLVAPAFADVAPPLDTVPFVEIDSPAGPGSQSASLVAGKKAVYLTWIEKSDGAPVLKLSRNTGTGWSAPQTVLSDPRMVANAADVPKFLALDNGMLVVAWLHGQGDAAEAYDVEVISSTDDGATWHSLGRPHADKARVEHGFVSLLPHAGDGFWIAWLDGRNHANASHSPGVGQHGANTELRVARWRDGHFEAETKLDERVCDCCQTAAVVTLEGLAVAYRDRGPKETRDISLVRYERQAWSKPIPIRNDNWVIDGCPVNGPAMAAKDQNLALAWYTDANDQPQVFVALSDSSSFGLSRIVKVDDGRPMGRVDVEWLADQSALVTWVEQTGDATADIRVKRVTVDGTVSGSKTLATTGTGMSSGFPQLAARDIGIWVAWTDPASHKVRLGHFDLMSTD
ncbi:MAG TPA: hypothetical protein VF720_13775 [Candidatus Eisenbacteria bacterium]